MNIERALSIEGWMEPSELTYLAEAASRSRRIVEIGSWAGRSACALGMHTPGVVHCVDSWERSLTHNGPDGKLEPTLFNQFCRNTAGLPIIPVMAYSAVAAGWFARAGMTFDMIWIDADHTEPQVRADILAWRPLLAEGGILCGHDYEYTGWPDVKPVVDELVPGARIIGSIWTTEQEGGQ